MLAFRRHAFACLCLVLIFCGALSAQSYNKVVVFGDSLSDTGNIAHLVQNGNPLNIRFPADNQLLGFNYTDGRFTDGTDTQPAAKAYLGVWIEQLAASFAAKPAVKNSLDGGTDYAYGDATTANGSYTRTATYAGLTVSIAIENMGQQVTDYLNTNPTPNAQTVYVLWGGSNDLYAASDSGQDPIAAAGIAVQNELALVQRLIAAGGTNFIIPNLPPLGGVPSYGTSPAATALNTASAVFGQALAQGISALKLGAQAQGKTITVYQPDILSLFATFAGSPMAVGLSNVTGSAQGISASPDTYLIWDGLHPTTTGHHYAAAAAANLITPLVASSTALTVPAVAVAGQNVTLSAKVSSSASSAIPTGLVSFFNGTTLVGSAALDATGTGTATFAASAAASPYSLKAIYVGDTTFNVSASSAQALTVLTSAVGTTTTVNSSSLTANQNASVTFTATVAPAVSTYGGPVGTVTFLDGTTNLGTGTVSNGSAVYTTSSLSVGTHVITATYAGGGVFGGSTSAAINQVIAAPAFTTSASPTSITVNAGSTGMTTLTAAGTGGYSGTITLACGTLPAHLSCAFSATTLTLSASAASQSSTLSIATNVHAAMAMPDRPGALSAPRVFSAMLGFPAVGGLLFLGLSRRRRSLGSLRLSALLLVVSAGACLGLSGCGGGNDNAAKGTYTVPVTFTPSTGTAQTVNVTVNVQ